MPKVIFTKTKLSFRLNDAWNNDHTAQVSYTFIRLWGALQAPYDGHMNLFKNKARIENLTGRLSAIFIYDKDGEVRYFVPDEMTDFEAKRGRVLILEGPTVANELMLYQRERTSGENGGRVLLAVFNETQTPAGGVVPAVPPIDDATTHGDAIGEGSEDDSIATDD